MKRFLFFLIIATLTAAPAFAKATERMMIARVTVYWHGEGSRRASWNGARLANGNCAVDPKKIPYGSKVVLGEDELVAVDTGPAVVSRRAARSCGKTTSERSALVIDRYFESKREAIAWEKSHPHFMSVQIRPVGSSSPTLSKQKDLLYGALVASCGGPIGSVASDLLALNTGK